MNSNHPELELILKMASERCSRTPDELRAMALPVFCSMIGHAMKGWNWTHAEFRDGSLNVECGIPYRNRAGSPKEERRD